ncbi:MAG: hypothetical protein NTU44_16950 [Bacteroidetes bacterium]|nr:hypothetical protein [Bacteroidota bacterium]
MKAKSSILFCIILGYSLLISMVFAQVGNYSFTPLADTFVEVSLGDGAVQPLISGGDEDDGWYNNIYIGFNFVYEGAVFTSLSASTNGFLLIGANLRSSQPNNNLATGTLRPKLAPLWDDLAIGSSGSFLYLTTGNIGSRVFMAQWLGMYWNYDAIEASISFQVKLYEGDNMIEFIYRQESETPFAAGASIGLAGMGMGPGNFISLNSSGNNPQASNFLETPNISTRPTSGQVYRFYLPGAVPACAISPAPADGITTMPALLSWSDGGGGTLGYKVYLGTVNPPTTLVQNNSSLSYLLSGLTSNTHYYWKIVPYNGAGEVTGCPIWSFITPIPLFSISGQVEYSNTISTPMDYTIVQLRQDTSLLSETQTNSNGSFQFINLPEGDYHLTTQCNKPWGGVNSIDALLILKYFVGLTVLEGLSLQVADVNNTINVNSSDALLACSRFAGLVSSFAAGDWKFTQPVVTLAGSNATNLTIKGLAVGDVNGSYKPPACPEVTFSNAGPDQLSLFDTVAILAANVPGLGEAGTWSIVEGSGGSFSDIHYPVSTFWGTEGNSYTLKWTMSNYCNNNSDMVIIHFGGPGNLCPGIPSFTYSGQVYHTVLIGTQCWMRENMNIGMMVNSVYTTSDHSECSNNGIIEKYCYNNDPDYCSIFGGLYDWNEMMLYTTSPGTQGICPIGWHIPTDEEWCELTTYIDPTINCNIWGWNGTDCGGKMKETGFIHWTGPNTGTTNESGFTGFGAGYRYNNGDFDYANTFTVFWSSSDYSLSEGVSRYLYCNYANLNRNYHSKVHGFSVRCVKNE